VAAGELKGNTYRTKGITLFVSKCPRKLLLLDLVSSICGRIKLQEIPGVKIAHVQEKGNEGEAKRIIIETEGRNLGAVWELDPEEVDHNTFYTNDIAQMLDRYGVEACRASIIAEIQNVFGHYGISVDRRHLSLIADSMTQQGGFNAFNRTGIQFHASPILKMSFETCTQFLNQACQQATPDDLQSPAAAIVFGKHVNLGTGAFDLVQDLPKLNTQAKKMQFNFS